MAGLARGLYGSIGAIESLRPDWIDWWAICGDLQTDYISAADAEPPQLPREAMLVFAENWLGGRPRTCFLLVFVIPAKAGIQKVCGSLDSRFRGNDVRRVLSDKFLGVVQVWREARKLDEESRTLESRAKLLMERAQDDWR